MPPTRKLPTEKRSVQSHCNSSVKQYIGATESTIKQGLYKHKLSFINRNYSSNTSLYSYIGAPKRHEHVYHYHLGNTKYNKASRKCHLCPPKKLAIITYPSQTATQKIRNSIQMQTWEQTPLIFQPIYITYPYYQYQFYFNKSPTNEC